jgi:hypothetical protein
MPDGGKLLVSQDALPAVLDPALFQPDRWIGFEQISIDGKIENLTHRAVNAIGGNMLAGADNALDQFDDIGAADSAEVALAPLRQNMEGEVPPILLGGPSPLVAFGMFLQVAGG